MSHSQRTHNGGLYCSEGHTHVNRPSVRVRQPPGGGQTGGWLSGYQEEIKPVKKDDLSEASGINTKNSVDQGKTKEMIAESRTSLFKESTLPLSQEEESKAQNENSKVEYNALYCNEGNQIRNRPSVRVRGEQQRDYNILHPN